MTSENVLITGGAGFIGRALVARCLAGGHRVAVVDNLCAGRVENLAPFIGAIDFRELDIRDEKGLRSAVGQVQPAVVFHLAAHHYIPFCDRHPRETLQVNVEGTYQVLDAAARVGARRAVVASTGALYPSRETPLDEDISPDPSDVYGLSKLMAEQVVQFMARTTRLTCVIARLFNTYGPFETNPHLIPHIIESLRRNGSWVSLGNIDTRRDYVYVDDVADSLYRSAFADVESTAVVNVGTGQEYSAREIVEEIGRLLDRPCEIRVDAARVRGVDKPHQIADTRRLGQLLGPTTRLSLREGLRRLLVHEQML